jgi:hypothetical protein
MSSGYKAAEGRHRVGVMARARESEEGVVRPRPQIGQIVFVYGVRCRIFKVRPCGTIDVEEVDGPRAWRLSGLGFAS